MPVSDALLIGGGIIGCSVARALAARGLSVAVIERGLPGHEASWAAAGMLSPSAEADPGSALFDLSRASLQLYRGFAQQLTEETSIDPQYRDEGTLVIFENEVERQSLLESFLWQRTLGITIAEVSSQELGRREPSLARSIGAFHVAGDHQIDNRFLVQALVESCRRHGVEFVSAQAREILHDGSRVTAVLTDKGEITAGIVINTAGAWAGCLNVRGLKPLPIRPVKGQMLALKTADPVLNHVVRSEHVYLVPRRDGRIIVGSSMEEAGFDKTPRAGVLVRLLCAAQNLCPALAESAMEEFWAGLRPAALDGLPILGPTEIQGYWVALGHFRNGILLAPITAQVMSSWILTGTPGFAMQPFRADRFR